MFPRTTESKRTLGSGLLRQHSSQGGGLIPELSGMIVLALYTNALLGKVHDLIHTQNKATTLPLFGGNVFFLQILHGAYQSPER